MPAAADTLPSLLPMPPLCLPLQTITTKGFAKKVACYPEALSALDFDAFTSLFTPDERVHIVMLVSEARRQAALLYALHAVMKSLGPGA